MALRAMFGVFIIAGAFIGMYNIYKTIRYGELFEPKPVTEDTPVAEESTA